MSNGWGVTTGTPYPPGYVPGQPYFPAISITPVAGEPFGGYDWEYQYSQLPGGGVVPKAFDWTIVMAGGVGIVAGLILTGLLRRRW